MKALQKSNPKSRRRQTSRKAMLTSWKLTRPKRVKRKTTKKRARKLMKANP